MSRVAGVALFLFLFQPSKPHKTRNSAPIHAKFGEQTRRHALLLVSKFDVILLRIGRAVGVLRAPL